MFASRVSLRSMFTSSFVSTNQHSPTCGSHRGYSRRLNCFCHPTVSIEVLIQTCEPCEMYCYSSQTILARLVLFFVGALDVVSVFVVRWYSSRLTPTRKLAGRTWRSPPSKTRGWRTKFPQRCEAIEAFMVWVSCCDVGVLAGSQG